MSDIQAKIRIGDGGVEGYNQFTLKPGYTTNADTPYEIQDTPTTQLTGQNQLATFHDNDDGPPEIINLEENNRVWAFTLKVKAGSKKLNTAALSTLKRHISGKQSTAYQAYRNGSQEFVWFDIRLDSDSLWTSYKIMRGVIDDGQAFYTTAADKNDRALSCLVNLTCVPAGRGETIGLRNDLPSSPHMVESHTANIADGWSVSGGAVPALSTNSLIGGQSQNVVFPNPGAAFYQDVGSGASTKAAAYFWVHMVTGQVNFGIFNWTTFTGSSAISVTPSTIAAAASDSFTAQNGDIFYKLEFAFTFTAGDLMRFQALSQAASECVIDAGYFQFDIDTAPKAFTSSYSLKNRYDPTNTSAATRQQINYLDVWGVPGDLPAFIKMKTNIISASSIQQMVAAKFDGIMLASDGLYNTEGEGFSGAGWSTVVDSTVSGGNYKRNANTGAASTAADTIAASSAFRLSRLGAVRVFARAKANAADCTLRFRIEDDAFHEIVELDDADVPNDTNWYLVDLGVVDLSDIYTPDADGAYSIRLELIAAAAGVANIDVDVLYFMPTDSFMIYTPSSNTSTITTVLDNNTEFYYDEETFRSTPLLGKLNGSIPNAMTRYIIITTNKNAINFINDVFTVNLDITPMSSHLLGG